MSTQQVEGARKVLTAPALTYVAGALTRSCSSCICWRARSARRTTSALPEKTCPGGALDCMEL